MAKNQMEEKLLAIRKKKYAVQILNCTVSNGMTTLGEVWQEIGNPQLSLQAVRKAADWLTAPPQNLNIPALLERHQPKILGLNGRPGNFYLRTESGTTFLNELLLGAEVHSPKIRDSLDLTHRYLTLKIAEIAKKEGHRVYIEHLFKNSTQEVRADFYAKIKTINIIVEVEQKLLRRNIGRARDKFRHWTTYLQAESPGIWRIYLVLNVRKRDLPTLIRYWQEALDDTHRELGELPFDVYVTTASELLGSTSFIDTLFNAQILEDIEDSTEYPAIRLDDEDEFKQEYPDYIDEGTFLRFQEALDDLLEAPPARSLAALIELATQIYTASFYPNSPTMKSAVFPWASIWLLRRYLDDPRMADVKRELSQSLTRIHKRNPGMVMLRETVTSLLWDVLLFHHGLGRGGPLSVVFQVPDFQDRSSDFRVEVRLSDALTGKYTQETKALGWLLGSIYLYRQHLGLIANTKK